MVGCSFVCADGSLEEKESQLGLRLRKALSYALSLLAAKCLAAGGRGPAQNKIDGQVKLLSFSTTPLHVSPPLPPLLTLLVLGGQLIID